MVQKSGDHHRLDVSKPCEESEKLLVNWLAGYLPSTFRYFIAVESSGGGTRRGKNPMIICLKKNP